MKNSSSWAAWLCLSLSTSFVTPVAAVDIGAYSYTSKPMPVLTVNGRQNQILLYPGQPFNAQMTLEAGDAKGQMADWWVVAAAGEAMFYLPSKTGVWQSGLQPSFQAPLEDFKMPMISNLSLPPGEFDLFFGVDTQPDGKLSFDSLRFDWVHISIPNTAQRVFYVAPQGDDNNPGNAAQPWKTLSKAAASVQAGDLVWVRAGTYKEQLAPKTSGVAGSPIVFAAYPGETVILEGKGLTLTKNVQAGPAHGVIHVIDVNYVWIVGFTVKNTSDAGIMGYRTDNLVVQDNYVTNSASSGILIWKSTHLIVDGNEVNQANQTKDQENISIGEDVQNFEIRYNHVHDSLSNYIGAAGIDVKDGSGNGSIHHNHVHHIKPSGCLYIDGWDSLSENIEIHHNSFHDSKYHGLALDAENGGQVKNINIYNNISYNNGVSGVAVGTNFSGRTEGVNIYNNSFYNNGFYDNGKAGPAGGFGTSVYIDNKNAKNINVFNNACNSKVTQVSVLAGSKITIKNNLFAREQNTKYNGATNGDPYFLADPLWLDPNNGDFRLKAGSPAIGQGSASLVPPTDFRGQPR